MSHRITPQRASEIRELEDRNKELIKSGVDVHSVRRHKKYVQMMKRRYGFLWRMKKRLDDTDAVVPERLQKIFKELDKEKEVEEESI